MTRIAKIDALLNEAMGLDSTSIGASSVERAVRARMAELGASTLREYWQRLAVSPEELQELIELVVVPETWFFREREAFGELARIATEELSATRAARPLRLLSLPCSTGEEPYSIAMALRDAGLPSGSFTVYAVDISLRALDHARRAVYGNNSFRGADLAFRDRHFDKTAQGHRLHDGIRESVRFRHGNVHADDFLLSAEPYDAVFCRNLLIYFNEPTQQRTIAALERLLGANGTLFVGPAETSLFLNRGFVPSQVPLAFALQRAPKVSAEATPPRRRPSAPAPLAAKAAPARSARSIARTRVAARVTAPSPPPARTAIDRAFELADQGKLAEAMAICDTELRERGPSAQAYYLQGLIHSADGLVSEADRCYRKALYLDSTHHDALLHLAALTEKLGDARGAHVLRQRARRS